MYIEDSNGIRVVRFNQPDDEGETFTATEEEFESYEYEIDFNQFEIEHSGYNPEEVEMVSTIFGIPFYTYGEEPRARQNAEDNLVEEYQRLRERYYGHLSPFNKESEVAKESKQNFLDSLNNEQKTTYKSSGVIFAEGSEGGRYQIICRSSTVQNIWDCNKDVCYCISIKRAAEFDVWLSQKLLIETDEESFLKNANHYEVKRQNGYRDWSCIYEGELGGAQHYGEDEGPFGGTGLI